MLTSAYRRLLAALLGIDPTPGDSRVVDGALAPSGEPRRPQGHRRTDGGTDDAPAVAAQLGRRARSSALVIGVAAATILPAWSLFDFYLEPELAPTFTAVRMLCLLPIAVCLWLLWARPVGRREPEVLVLAILAVVQADIAWMVAQVDNVESYAVGLCLAVYGSGGVLAAPVRWTGAVAAVTWISLGAAAAFAPGSIEASDGSAIAFHLGTATVVALLTHALRQAMALSELRSRVGLEREQERTRALLTRLERLSHEDALTGVANRRRWDAELVSACAQARTDGTPVAVVVVDLDHFKRVNDRHGHAGGDAALREVAQLLTTGVRGGDLVARIGGDELAVLMPGADVDRAVELAESARRRACLLRPPGFGPGEVTVSLGVAVARGGDAFPLDLMTRADEQLYVAKATRNAVGAPADAAHPPARPAARLAAPVPAAAR